jgi:hypothetical protein
VIKRESSIWVEIFYREPLVSRMSSTQEVEVKGAQDNSSLFMIMKFTALMLNDLNLISPMTLVGTSMEVSCVLISLYSCSYFTVLFPELKLRLSDPVEYTDDERAKVALLLGKGASLLNMIKKVDHNPAVGLLLGEVGLLFSPHPKLKPSIFQFSSKDCKGVTVAGLAIPRSVHNCIETGIVDPEILKARG